MENYNPRQNTRMRWKDAAEMEKYMFLTGGFNFQTEVLENALIDENYKRLALEINKCAEKSTRKGLIIEDNIFGGMYIGEIADDNSARIISIDAEFIKIVDFNLDEIDIPNYIKMSINVVDEHTVSADNVKTLFGNQSIIGTGNIDLYRHDLIIYHNRTNYDDYAYKVYVTYYSSNPLKVDSVQDLTTLTKAVIGTELIGPVVINNTSGDDDYDTVSQSYIGVRYNGNIWGICSLNDGTITTLPINKVSDTVTTI